MSDWNNWDDNSGNGDNPFDDNFMRKKAIEQIHGFFKSPNTTIMVNEKGDMFVTDSQALQLRDTLNDMLQTLQGLPTTKKGNSKNDENKNKDSGENTDEK